MTMENQINELAAALVAAQAELTNPPKTRTAKGTKFSYTYADLADVTDVIRPVFTKHGLCMLHLMEPVADGYVLKARILHKSGQFLDSVYPVPGGLGAQDLGSWMTYMRRYSACNLAFVAGETDDDGEGGQSGQQAATEAEVEAKREAARRKLAEANAASTSRKVSAYDGRELKQGESPLPKDAPPPTLPATNTKPAPAPTQQAEPQTDLDLVPKALRDLMTRDGVTVAQLTAFASGYLPPGTALQDFPGDFFESLVEQWKNVSRKIKKGEK